MAKTPEETMALVLTQFISSHESEENAAIDRDLQAL